MLITKIISLITEKSSTQIVYKFDFFLINLFYFVGASLQLFIFYSLMAHKVNKIIHRHAFDDLRVILNYHSDYAIYDKFTKQLK